jgi:hypothetical protein
LTEITSLVIPVALGMVVLSDKRRPTGFQGTHQPSLDPDLRIDEPIVLSERRQTGRSELDRHGGFVLLGGFKAGGRVRLGG